MSADFLKEEAILRQSLDDDRPILAALQNRSLRTQVESDRSGLGVVALHTVFGEDR